ncbi:rhomboid family intramembrane serine protease [Occallatibacter savannae]|uniref:rhomboid family intramembrane serine protease n=1 Tax=Occallatibacter savannae TaxID=1002691 RepID=UPI000D693A93|nr:rhomboid family intramembrane serine protease [Occallatibacter savannae]
MSSVPPVSGYEESGREPEILRPDAENVPTPQPVVRRRRSFWKTAPATYVLVGVNVAVFVLMLLRHVSGLSPSPEQLMHWGANNAGSVLADAEWWRVVTAMFVHVGIIHLATNMWCLWNLGLLAEPLMGSFGVVAVYVLTGAAGNLLSVTWNGWHIASILPQVPAGIDPAQYFSPGAGASGAVFGIAGALIVLLKSPRLPVPPDELKRLRKSVIYFAAINLVIGLTISLDVVSSRTGISIDNSAHLGGVLCGLLFAAPMVPRIGNPKPVFLTRLQVAVGMIVGILVLFGFYISRVLS